MKSNKQPRDNQPEDADEPRPVLTSTRNPGRLLFPGWGPKLW